MLYHTYFVNLLLFNLFTYLLTFKQYVLSTNNKIKLYKNSLFTYVSCNCFIIKCYKLHSNIFNTVWRLYSNPKIRPSFCFVREDPTRLYRTTAVMMRVQNVNYLSISIISNFLYKVQVFH